MNTDNDFRRYRFIEVLDPGELIRRRKGTWALVDGWLELAERLEPKSPKALLEGDFIVRLADGTVFKEISYKTEHPSVEAALPDWSASCARRWAMIKNDSFMRSDGVNFMLEHLTFERVP